MDSLEQFTRRAARAPYELSLGGDKVMKVEHPTNAQWREALEADDVGGFLEALGADPEDAAIVREAFAGSDWGSETALVRAMAEFFGQGN